MGEKYKLRFENIDLEVEIFTDRGFIPSYEVNFPKLDEGTGALYLELKNRMISELELTSLGGENIEAVKKEFRQKAEKEIQKVLPKVEEGTKNYLIGLLIQEMLGLGRIEILLQDPNLEEIVINSAKEGISVYHKKYGWTKTNILIDKEEDILNYSAIIARSIGKQVNVLNPLLDAHLPTGDRVNATLFPISNEGNTMTIRKFRREPWTITDFIENKTISLEVAAFMWFSVQYEMNLIVSGGTGTGKTSFLTTLLSFMPPNQRILSIEDTREIKLPDFLHWVPMVTRMANQEGKGEINMLDLLINALRMRPDRIILGEVRRSREAEVLFEAMHTGHSICATLHADTALQTYRRLTSPPISVPESLMEAVDLFVVMFRDRRKGIRRVYEIAEVLPQYGRDVGTEKINTLYKWDAATDTLAPYHESKKAIGKMEMLLGLSRQEIQEDLKKRERVLEYMLKKNIRNVNEVGKITSGYMKNPEDILKKI
ncbi:MAG: type II/IV secretion system ATPase subunit [Candidatus Aenigmarchaeota archaeon]|nr:type II/IV secretion system ATPase subunit [Candidatus Aenigmarchaeota archaeon]